MEIKGRIRSKSVSHTAMSTIGVPYCHVYDRMLRGQTGQGTWSIGRQCADELPAFTCNGRTRGGQEASENVFVNSPVDWLASLYPAISYKEKSNKLSVNTQPEGKIENWRLAVASTVYASMVKVVWLLAYKTPGDTAQEMLLGTDSSATLQAISNSTKDI
jgi:hypothetical protein